MTLTELVEDGCGIMNEGKHYKSEAIIPVFRR